MTPDEINRLIAEKCMGWYISRNPYGGGPEAWLFIDPPETYEDHYCLAPFHRLADFDPYHNISHAMMALEKFTTWRLERLESGRYACSSTSCTIWIDDTPSAAISLAIVEAMKGE